MLLIKILSEHKFQLWVWKRQIPDFRRTLRAHVTHHSIMFTGGKPGLWSQDFQSTCFSTSFCKPKMTFKTSSLILVHVRTNIDSVLCKYFATVPRLKYIFSLQTVTQIVIKTKYLLLEDCPYLYHQCVLFNNYRKLHYLQQNRLWVA